MIGKFPDFRKMVTEAGRDPATLPITVYGVAEDLELLKRYRDAGTARVIVEVPSAKADEVLPVLDRWAEFARKTG